MDTSSSLLRAFFLCMLTCSTISILEAGPRSDRSRAKATDRQDRKTARPRDEERQSRKSGTATVRPRDEERKERKSGTLRPRDEERKEKRFDRRDTPLRSTSKVNAVTDKKQTDDVNVEINRSIEEADKTLKRWDSDGDGNLSQEEIDARNANKEEKAQTAQDKWIESSEDFVEKNDTNGDGKVDRTEMKAAYDAHKAKNDSTTVVYYANPYADEDLADEEEAAVEEAIETAQQRKVLFLARYDTNKDGKIDAAEFTAAVNDIKKAKKIKEEKQEKKEDKEDNEEKEEKEEKEDQKVEEK